MLTCSPIHYQMYNTLLGVSGLLCCKLSLANGSPLTRKTGSHSPVFCPLAGYIMALMLLLHIYQRFPAYFICRSLQVSLQTQRLPKANSGLLCLGFTDPVERGSHHCSIYLGSMLNSKAPHLFGSNSRQKLQCFHANLSKASSAYQQYSTAHTPLTTDTIHRTHHFPLSAYTEQTCRIMISSCL